MAKKNVSLLAPKKEKKEGQNKPTPQPDNLVINPSSVMVELAQTGAKSKFFDVISKDEVMPQTAEDN